MNNNFDLTGSIKDISELIKNYSMGKIEDSQIKKDIEFYESKLSESIDLKNTTSNIAQMNYLETLAFKICSENYAVYAGIINKFDHKLVAFHGDINIYNSYNSVIREKLSEDSKILVINNNTEKQKHNIILHKNDNSSLVILAIYTSPFFNKKDFLSLCSKINQHYSMLQNLDSYNHINLFQDEITDIEEKTNKAISNNESVTYDYYYFFNLIENFRHLGIETLYDIKKEIILGLKKIFADYTIVSITPEEFVVIRTADTMSEISKVEFKYNGFLLPYYKINIKNEKIFDKNNLLLKINNFKNYIKSGDIY